MQSQFDSKPQQSDEAALEADKLARMGRMQKQIDEINRQASGAVNQVGARALDLYRRGQLPVAELLPLCQMVLSLEAQVGVLQASLVAIQQEVMLPDVVTCPHCHVPITAQARFCPNCGQPVTAAPAVQPAPTCPSCNAPTVIGAAFCGNCGYRLIPEEPPSVSAPQLAVTPAPPEPISEAGSQVTVHPAGASPEAMPSAQPAPAIESPPPMAAQPVPVPVAPVPQPWPGAPVPPDTTPLLPVCPRCGERQRRADVRFCRVCGASMTVPPAPAGTTST